MIRNSGRLLAPGLILAVFLQFIAVGDAFADVEFNHGEDFASPLRRFDIRGIYQDNQYDKFNSYTVLRLDLPFRIGNGWILATRYDQPLAYTEYTSGGDKFGAGDLLLQAFFIAPQMERTWTWGTGIRSYIPVVADNQIGSGRYTVAPMVGFKINAPFISSMGFLGLLVSNHFDMGGEDDRAEVEFMAIQPTIFANLNDYWFIMSKPEMRVNWELDGRWFIPLDLQVGLLLGRSMVLSAAYRIPIVDDLPLYKHEFETHIGFFF